MRRFIIPVTLIITLLFLQGLPVHAGSDKTVTVLYFDNNSGMSEFATLGKGLADMLITDLTKHSGMQVVEREKLEKLLDELKLQKTEFFDEKTSLQLGKGVGADYAVTGAIYVIDVNMRIDLRVIDIASGNVLLADKVTGRTDKFFDLQMGLTESVIKGLSDKLSRKARKKILNEAKSNSVKKFRSLVNYADGLDLADKGDFDAASKKMEEVIKEEPKFALAKTRNEEILEKLLETTKEIKAQTDRIEAQTQEIARTMENISKSFEILAKQGGLIPAPSIPEEFYHNARIYELNGDYGNARRAYLEYFKFGLDFVDPHLRFLTFLKVQEGRAGAREVYGYISKQSKSFVPEFVASLLFDRENRIDRLNEFVQKHPEFGPAYYELSNDYSETRRGKQTLEDKEFEQKYLERFSQLDQEGHLVRYFLDKEMVAEWRKDAEDRLAALKFVSTEAMKNPVTVSWMKTNSGWMGNISIAELVLEIFYRTEGESIFRSTGHQPYLNPQTGHKIPKQSLSLPFTQKPIKVWVKYKNIHGKVRGPYESTLNPQAADIQATKSILDMTKNSWISYRDWEGKLLAYFSHLMSYRGAISQIKYGIDRDMPDQEYKFPPFDGPGTAGVTSDVPIYIVIPKGTKYMTVQVTYKDGVRQMQKFMVP